jgi:hypothetical protein
MIKTIVPIKEVIPDLVSYLCNPPDSIKLHTWATFNEIVGGFRPKEFSILCGSTGCLGGSAKIPINRAKKGLTITIQELYETLHGISPSKYDASIPTFVRSFNGQNIQLHKVKNVFISGIKKTWRLNTDQKSGLRLTNCHRVMTTRGWVRADHLVNGDLIAMDSGKPSKRLNKKDKAFDSFFGRVKFHPHKTKCNHDFRIAKHRAIYEANLNNLTIDEYLKIIRFDESTSNKLKFINPNTYHIHHIDENHQNNEIDNLQMLLKAEHFALHGDESNFNQGQIRWCKFTGLDMPSEEAVYDIECEDPFHNFIANGLVVHNSGKTSLLANWSAELLAGKVKHFVMSVETGHMDFLARVVSVMVNEDLNTGDPVPREKLLRIGVNNHEKLFSEYIELSLYDNRVPLEHLLADLKWAVENGCKIAFIDNLNFFMNITNEMNAVVEMDRVTHELIMFCKRNPIHIVLIMHPKKTVQGTRVLSEFDIKGSSTAVQEANNIFLFNRPDPKDIESGESLYTDRELLIAKMRRRGKYVGRTLVYNGKYPKYAEIGTMYDVHRDGQENTPKAKAVRNGGVPYKD